MTQGIVWVAGLLAAAAGPDLPRFTHSVEVVDQVPSIRTVARGERVEVVFRFGELRLEAANVGTVRTDLIVGCAELPELACRSYRERLRLVARSEEGVVRVELVGLSKWSLRRLDLEGRVVYPRWAPLTVRLGAGVADVVTGERGVEVSMGVGELTIRSPLQSVGSVALRTRIGDASLTGAPREARAVRPLLVGARVEWSEGPGPVAIRARLGIGDARVVLE
jgi:hypothetical protein